MAGPLSWTVESYHGTVVNDPPLWTFGNPNAAEARIRIKDDHDILQTADITLKAEFFTPNMLDRGLPIKGLVMRICDPVFGDHRYTIVGAEQTDPLYYTVRCLVD